MEFGGGGDFATLLNKHPNLPDSVVKLFLAEMILGLEYLHNKKIYHKDIKPQNILISNTGHFKLTDFGLSEGDDMEEENIDVITNTNNTNNTNEDYDESDTNNNSSLFFKDESPASNIIIDVDVLKKTLKRASYNFINFTERPDGRRLSKDIPSKYKPRSIHYENLKDVNFEKLLKSNKTIIPEKILGTSHYMSPEIIRNDSESPAKGEADFWALGVIIYLIYAKKLPFIGETAFEIFDKIMEYNIDWETLENSKINRDLLDITKKLLIYDQDDRIEEIKHIKESPYFDGFNWDNCLKSESPLKKYAIENIKKPNQKIKEKPIKKIKEEPKIEILETTNVTTKKTFVRQNSYASVKLDNLAAECERSIKNDFRKDVMEFNPDNEGNFNLDI